jgi:signal transduction histidine kinase
VRALHRFWSRLPFPSQVALLAAAYVAVAQLGLLYATAPGKVSAVWPLSGLVLVLLLRGGLRYWPAVVVGDLLVALTLGNAIPLAAWIAGSTTIEALLGAVLLRRATGGEPTTVRVHDVVALIGLAGGLSSAIGGAIGVAGMLLGGAIGVADLTTTWLTWWVGDLIGVLLITPLFLTCDRYFRSVVTPCRLVEAMTLYLLLVTVALIVFRGHLNYSFFAAPLIIWAALRVGSRGAAIATLLFSMIAINSTALGNGPFVRETPATSLLFLQTFIGTIAVLSLVLSAVIAERRAAEKSLRLVAEWTSLLARWSDETTPPALARLLAEHIADLCIIELAAPHGIRRVSVAASRRLETSASRIHEMAAAPWAPLAQSTLLSRLPLHGTQAGRHALYEVADVVRAKAALFVPLVVQGHSAGAVALYTTGPGRIYANRDLMFAEELAQRMSQAIERTWLEAQVVQAQKMESIGQLAGGVAHDFNNLLTVILSSAEMMREHPADAAGHEDLEAITEAAERARTLTRRLLMFSRKQTLDPVVVDVASLLHDLAPLLRRLLPATIDVRLDVPAELEPIRIDVAQFELVLMNLVINARDAMPAGGTLTIEAGEALLNDAHAGELFLAAGRYLRLTVHDTGIGMDEAVRRHVFEPFFTTKPPGQGTGLGLATSYGIVRQSGGHIAVASAPGAGTTFTIYLPFATQLAPEGQSALSTTVSLKI